MSAINEWLETLGFRQRAEVFAANDIDMEVLPELTEEDLKTLGVSMGHRKKLMKAIVALSAPDIEALQKELPRRRLHCQNLAHAHRRKVSAAKPCCSPTSPVTRP